MTLRNRILKVTPMQRVPEGNLESSSSHSFPESSSQDQPDALSPTISNEIPSENLEEVQDGTKKEECEPPDSPCALLPHNSLEQLAHLPYSSSSGRSISVASTNSRAGSMPSLSSILEQDLTSLGTTSVADSTSSSTDPRHIQLKLTPPPETAFDDHQRMIHPDPARIATTTPVRTPLLRQEWNHLEGTTLEVLEATIEKKNARCTSRWQSGNTNLGPLTHAQKLLLPRRGDVQPRSVSRQESDLSMA